MIALSYVAYRKYPPSFLKYAPLSLLALGKVNFKGYHIPHLFGTDILGILHWRDLCVFVFVPSFY